MKKTVAYCRTAFAEPSDPLAGVSAQAASLREYAGRHGMTVDGTYMDAGASGMTLIRPALQQLLADCRRPIPTARSIGARRSPMLGQFRSVEIQASELWSANRFTYCRPAPV
jgi:hypothetical protein